MLSLYLLDEDKKKGRPEPPFRSTYTRNVRLGVLDEYPHHRLAAIRRHAVALGNGSGGGGISFHLPHAGLRADVSRRNTGSNRRAVLLCMQHRRCLSLVLVLNQKAKESSISLQT